MRTSVVLTLTGADRVGIVEDVTQALLDLDANVEMSRMARLGGEFAMLMLVSLSPQRLEDLAEALERLGVRGSTVVTSHEKSHVRADSSWLSYRVDVEGADHEGIVHDIAAGLAQRGISIESAETTLFHAPVSGTPLFAMSAVVMVPPDLTEPDWLVALDEAGRLSNVDVRVTTL